jgi:hypothetical protein
LDSTTRTRLPPTLTRATWRKVWLRSERGMATGAKKSGSQTSCGLAVQVPIQSPAAVGSARSGPVLSPAARVAMSASANRARR